MHRTRPAAITNLLHLWIVCALLLAGYATNVIFGFGLLYWIAALLYLGAWIVATVRAHTTPSRAGSRSGRSSAPPARALSETAGRDVYRAVARQPSC